MIVIRPMVIIGMAKSSKLVNTKEDVKELRLPSASSMLPKNGERDPARLRAMPDWRLSGSR
jgi:hypothetical protein